VAHRLLAECLLTSDPAAATEHLEQALEILERIGARNEVAKAWVVKAALGQARGEAAEPRALLDRARARFEELGTLDESARLNKMLAVKPGENSS